MLDMFKQYTEEGIKRIQPVVDNLRKLNCLPSIKITKDNVEDAYNYAISMDFEFFMNIQEMMYSVLSIMINNFRNSDRSYTFSADDAAQKISNTFAEFDEASPADIEKLNDIFKGLPTGTVFLHHEENGMYKNRLEGIGWRNIVRIQEALYRNPNIVQWKAETISSKLQTDIQSATVFVELLNDFRYLNSKLYLSKNCFMK